MSKQETHKPAANLSLVDATMIGMGAMIGAGIFVLTGIVTDITGPSAVFVFVFNEIVTTFTALSYAELASSITIELPALSADHFVQTVTVTHPMHGVQFQRVSLTNVPTRSLPNSVSVSAEKTAIQT